MLTLIRLLLEEQSDLGLHSFVRPISSNTQIFYSIQHFKHYREKYFDIVSEGSENITSLFGMLYCSNKLGLITLCENVKLFWSCGPDCLEKVKILGVY